MRCIWEASALSAPFCCALKITLLGLFFKIYVELYVCPASLVLFCFYLSNSFPWGV